MGASWGGDDDVSEMLRVVLDGPRRGVGRNLAAQHHQLEAGAAPVQLDLRVLVERDGAQAPVEQRRVGQQHRVAVKLVTAEPHVEAGASVLGARVHDDERVVEEELSHLLHGGLGGVLREDTFEAVRSRHGRLS